VSADPVPKLDKFKAKHDLSIPLASDESLEALKAYGVWAKKSMYGRSYMGILRNTYLIGPDGRVAQVWEKVKVAGHAAEVLEAAKAL
jgi:peroxiredoxin Q/BCP